MHIVIVDPSRVAQKVIASSLRPSGHLLSTFEDSQAALDFVLADTSVDVLLTSLEVTPISGLELVWSIRGRTDLQRPLHIIVMSSSGSSRSLTEALDCGADDYIEKPPRSDALIVRLRAAERLLTAQRELVRLAETDPLTGLLNRRAFFHRLNALMGQSPRNNNFSALLLDIDHFKRVNDQHGHDVGDVVIKVVAENLQYSSGIAARLGGEEFAIVLPGASSSNAVAHAERLRQRIAQERFNTTGAAFQITCSIGVSEYQKGDCVDDLLKRADLSLYRAKSSGRNCVMAWESGFSSAAMTNQTFGPADYATDAA